MVNVPPTVSVAVPEFPFPTFEVTALVVFGKEPVVVPAVAVKLNVQVPPPGIVAPVSMIVAVTVSVPPPQTDVVPVGLKATTPRGESVKPTPVRAGVVVAFWLAMVIVNVEVPPGRTLVGL